VTSADETGTDDIDIGRCHARLTARQTSPDADGVISALRDAPSSNNSRTKSLDRAARKDRVNRLFAQGNCQSQSE